MFVAYFTITETNSRPFGKMTAINKKVKINVIDIVIIKIGKRLSIGRIDDSPMITQLGILGG